jgi:LPPG:FO 2-phospho-L-lactate transferase
MDALAELGVDTTFTLGDRDLAVCLTRTAMLADGEPLSAVTRQLSRRLGVDDVAILPATDDPVRTWVCIGEDWVPFQEYFVDRRHRDPVSALAYHGSVGATAAPGVVDAIDDADTVVIAPSNPPLSIWPILAIDEIADAVDRHGNRIAVSPLFGGRPLKGPADAVMRGVGLPSGTRGILEAYRDRIDRLFIDAADHADVGLGNEFDVDLVAMDTRLTGPDGGGDLARAMLASGVHA